MAWSTAKAFLVAAGLALASIALSGISLAEDPVFPDRDQTGKAQLDGS
jgi:hypothetical protein